MGIRIVKDGQVVQEEQKSPLEQKVLHLEKVITDLQNQIKDLKKPNVKKTNKKTSVR